MIRLVSTDFDGTLVAFEPAQEAPEEFFAWLRARRAAGTAWMINTGRWIDSVQERLETFRCDLWPEWVGCGERELYRLVRGAYAPVEPWNRDCTETHRRLAEEMHHVFDEIRAFLVHETNASCEYEREAFAGTVASSRGEADRISQFLAGISGRHPDIAVARNDIYFRFCHRLYHKGACLAEVRRLAGIPREETFACGDHFNDLPMLDTAVAGLLGCPSNAIPEVKDAVRAGRGHVASKPWTGGLVEALETLENRNR